MSPSSYIPAILLLIACGAYIFHKPEHLALVKRKSRLEHLKERRDVVYDNLRDLNFEFRAGKYPAEDYDQQRELLEAEAASLLTQIDALEAGAKLPAR